MVLVTTSTLLCSRNQQQKIKEWEWLCSNKTLFAKTGKGLDLACRPYLADPCSNDKPDWLSKEVLSHDLEAQCQIKVFRGKLGGDERSVPPSYTTTTTCTESDSPSPFSGPVMVSRLGWGPPVSYKPACIQLILGTSSAVRLWQAKALLEYIFFFFFFYSHHWQLFLAPNPQRWRWEPSCPHPGKDMKILFLLILREMEVLLKTARHEPELLKEWAGALLRLNLYAWR